MSLKERERRAMVGEVERSGEKWSCMRPLCDSCRVAPLAKPTPPVSLPQPAVARHTTASQDSLSQSPPSSSPVARALHENREN